MRTCLGDLLMVVKLFRADPRAASEAAVCRLRLNEAHGLPELVLTGEVGVC